MSADFHSLSLTEKKELAKDTFSFTFSTGGEELPFLPGQYVTVGLEVNGRFETRDFSIASSPTNQGFMMIVTKRGLSDFKKRLMELEKGDRVDISSPSGGFILDRQDTPPQVFISGGIGITPFYSMLKFAFAKSTNKSLTLFASFSRVEDIIFHEELLKGAANNPNIKVIYTVSSPITGWHGERGRIDEELLRKYIPEISVPEYFIVGKVEMVDDLFAKLREMEVPSEKIKIEYFTGY